MLNTGYLLYCTGTGSGSTTLHITYHWLLKKIFCTIATAVPKIGAFLLPIFRNVDRSWRVTSKLRGSTLIQVARRRSNVFQRFSASLVRVGDVQDVSRRHAVRGKKEPTIIH